MRASAVLARRADEEADRSLGRRRSNGQVMAMGAPVSASFMGLLLMPDNQAAAAEPAASSEAGPARDAEHARSGEPVGGGSNADAATPAAAAPALLFGTAAAAAEVGGATVENDAPSSAAGNAETPVIAAAADAAVSMPEGGAGAETVAPPLPDIGDVVLEFGSAEPFVLPTFAEEEALGRDENIGDLGDPRLVTREPIEPEPEPEPEIVPGDDLRAGDDASDPGAGGDPPLPGDSEAPAGNPGLRITGTPQNDYLVGTDGDDIIDAAGGKDTVLAGAGDDLVYGGPGNDVLRAGPGNDTIYGVAGNNEIFADEGNNLLFGGTGNDELFGGPGDDRLDGVAGTNRLYAGTGNDTLVVNDWRDAAVGNNEGPNNGGIDTVEVAPGFAASLKGRFSAAGPNGEATLAMGSSPIGRAFPDDVNAHKWQVNREIDQVRLTGDVGHDVVASDEGNTIWGNDGDNRLYGGAGDDTLYAGGGNDVLQGGAGDDTLYAGADNDVLFGGPGEDMLYGGQDEAELHGGAGDDLFVFGLAEGGKNTIFDHEGVNRLRFDGLEEPGALDARLDGSDLVIGHAGADIVRIADYANQREAFAGIEHQGEVLPLDQFTAGQATAAAASVTESAAESAPEPARALGDGSGAEDDLLAIYLGPQSVDATDDILDPARLDPEAPAHDAPFALYEDTAEQSFAGPPADAASNGGEDMLGSFMPVETLWVGPEEGLYVPENTGYAGDEAETGKG